jgi:hypothetical protein
MAIRTVDDVFQSDIGFGSGINAEVEGWLVVSSHLSYVVGSDLDEGNAVLVIAPSLYEQFRQQLALRGGSMVGFKGNAKILGKISRTGMSPLPYAFYRVEKILFEEADGGCATYIPLNNDDLDWFHF